MKMTTKILLATAAITACTMSVAAQAELSSLSEIEKFCDVKKSAAASIKEMRPMADGKTYCCLSQDGNAIEVYSYKTGEKVSTLFDVNNIKGELKINNFDGYEISENEKKILLWNNKLGIYRYSFTANYYVYDIMRGTLQRVTDGAPQRGATLSHDGRKVAWQSGNNIFIRNLEYDIERQVTTDGKVNQLIYGTPDWGYEEEFGIQNTIRWSPDDNVLVFMAFDESQVPEYSFDIYSGYCNPIEEYNDYPGQYRYKYPLAGYNNSVVSVLAYELDNKVTKKMDLPIQPTDYIPLLEYGGANDRLMVGVLNRDQNNLILYKVNPASTVAKPILTEKSEAWLSPYAYQMSRFNADGFVWGSDRSGYRHLYQYDYSGNMLRQLTSGEWYVTDYYGYNSKRKEHYVQTTQRGAINRNVSRITSAGKVEMLHPQDGTESAAFSRDFEYYVRSYSNAVTPPQYTLWSSSSKIKDLEMNDAYAAAYTNAPKKEFLQIPNAEGQMMNAFVIKPADFDPSKKYPLLAYQYNGPEAQEVANRWKPDGIYWFAEQGYVVVCADGRGTGYRSRAWSDAVYKHLGEYETADQISAAKYWSEQPYIDASRMACFGWSYGGYMTLMELSAPDCPFKAGISMAPVTDWRFYDSIYTERYMLTPQQNENGYNTASALNRTHNLKARLLIMSGTSDDNVHIYNTLKYTSKLTAEGKIFDMMAYTGFDHSLRMCNARVQLYRKITDFLNTQLK